MFKKIQLFSILLCVLGVCTDTAPTGREETATGYLVIRANVCYTQPLPWLAHNAVIYLPRAGWIPFILKFLYILVCEETKFGL